MKGRVIKRSGVVQVPIHIIPEWFNHNIIENKSEKIDKRYDNIDTNFNILIMGLLTSVNPNEDRKNLLNSFRRSFLK